MSIVVNALNIFVIAWFGMTVIHFYNRYTEYFFAMLIAVVYWAQLLVSSAYIETGIYLMDIGTKTFYFACRRLFILPVLYDHYQREFLHNGKYYSTYTDSTSSVPV